MATTDEKQLTQEIVTDWIGEELERAGDPFVLNPARVADGYGLDEDAVEVVCEKLSAKSGTPLTETDEGWMVEK